MVFFEAPFGSKVWSQGYNILCKGLKGNVRVRWVQEGSRSFKKVQEALRSFNEVQEGLRRIKQAEEGSIKKGALRF